MRPIFYTCQQIVKFFKPLFFRSFFVNHLNFYFIIHLSILLLLGSTSSADCLSADKALNQATGLYQRGNYLLSAVQFANAENENCKTINNKARWGYLLSLTEIGEKDETFYLSVKQYPEIFKQNDEIKLQVYQAYYFNIYKNPDHKNRVEAFEKWKTELPQKKSPALAGSLSALLPGAGQAYTGSWQSGAMAFVLNALFLSATLELKDKNLDNTALVSGVVFSITYLGNILNAAESAKLYNKNSNKTLIETEKQKQFPELQLGE